MKKETYKKFLEDRIENIKTSLENIKNRLNSGEINYPEYLYLENNIYSSLIQTQHEIYNLRFVEDFEDVA